MGALKGRWQSLRGLRISINRKRDHGQACQWIRMCILLHNLVIDVEGEEWARHYWQQIPPEDAPLGIADAGEDVEDADGTAGQKRRELVLDYDEYMEAVRMM
jgi:hypothetical protein